MSDFVIACIVGGIAGSVAACAAARYLAGGSLVRPGRSYCEACMRPVAWHDAIPLLSFLLLRGRCRLCGEHIPLYIFLSEIYCSLIAVLLIWRCSWSATTVLLAVFFWVMVALSIIDLASLRLPDVFLAAGLVPLAILLLRGDLAPWPHPLWASLGGAGLLIVLRETYRLVRQQEGLGWGDVKLVALLGLLTDITGIFEILCMAALLGLAASLVYRFSRGHLPVMLPFGPFLCTAAYLKVLWAAG